MTDTPHPCSTPFLISFRFAFLVFGVLLLSFNPTIAQSDDGFVPLFNGESLEGWVVENSGAGNFYVKDNILRVAEPEGWLRTTRQYANFILKVSFRFLTDDADSGIFVRVGTPTPFARGWPGNSYQVQTRDISKNRTSSPLLLGNHLPPPPTQRRNGI